MSVIRRTEVLGRTTRRRVVGVTAALSAAAVETLGVGLWFGLVVGSRTTTTALAGLGVLFCGALLRTVVVDATIGDLGDLLQPHRLAAPLLLTGGWICWLLVAELVGDVAGVAVATVVLTAVLTAQCRLERRVCDRYARYRTGWLVGPGLLLALGAAALLASAWFTGWTLSSGPISLGITTVVVRLEAVHLGAAAFGLAAVLAHQRRFQRLLGT
ncbi:hypothetical protein C488_05973 [Natrinema pellirubrum DSM 15624]|uniref:Uncharacterized protein n=1 Tax=Natrinema pellirubrum (strain DSM 15624 / CIP 106293 / JCM 10476 / NCIMB 786 / 157) TaxID=797303 RepID=L0JNS8_NATP1|nr:hypothetical protein [Natrinema pellirubrum]AGB32011.1 hypothetical protein Natpe_2186 [Natrinema pellirubrum DSM 15624]ELY78122.1 hypothetical protein C488_05973 [Natrinema pellirubrum DSM 15624]